MGVRRGGTGAGGGVGRRGQTRGRGRGAEELGPSKLFTNFCFTL